MSYALKQVILVTVALFQFHLLTDFFILTVFACANYFALFIVSFAWPVISAFLAKRTRSCYGLCQPN
ncbi:hypothetical protein Q7C_730 [Methylophaga frappieri]|uniref:Uncharacterized protein n=1 Tax=Methylophaga frappieri (strain ATCC BAA-2434 / DSM 25690 / JAM7) TaxID=754477 RepID=I1YG58_METFJ|nr:hypothetical protein Q7C_730 [Methylophaga frappieri]